MSNVHCPMTNDHFIPIKTPSIRAWLWSSSYLFSFKIYLRGRQRHIWRLSVNKTDKLYFWKYLHKSIVNRYCPWQGTYVIKLHVNHLLGDFTDYCKFYVIMIVSNLCNMWVEVICTSRGFVECVQYITKQYITMVLIPQS